MSLASCSYSNSEENLIDKIIEKGQRLRNDMVQSILDYDPFNIDVIKSASTMDLAKSRLRNNVPTQSSISSNDRLSVGHDKLLNFLKGDSMSRKEEIEAFVALKSMSSEDLCKTTNEAYSSPKCTCKTCFKYAREDLNCDLKRSSRKHDAENGDTESKRNKYLKYVDSLRVTVHELVLNENGNKKVHSCSATDRQMSSWGSQTFFIEYDLPFILSVPTHRRTHKKSTSSVKNNSFIRICARRLSTEAVSFKQTSMHNIRNVDQINLEGIDMKFHISCRTMRQKTATQLGFASFNFAKMEFSPILTYTEEMTISFNDKIPIVLGTLRVTVEMGCNKLYFGREFIASIEGTSKSKNKNEENAELVVSKICDKKPQKQNISTEKSADKSRQLSSIPTQGDLNTKSNEDITKTKQVVKPKDSASETVRGHEKHILFGFLYIPEAQYLKTNINSFLACRPFSQEDTIYSRLVTNESNPIFNFSQLVPLVYQEDLLTQLRDNFTIIEFWEKFETKNILFGSTKIQLHQFYIAYRNPEVTKYLAKNELPIIISDWWESITNPYTDELVGQVQVLLALGTEKQIQNLQLERGFKIKSIKANVVPPLGTKKIDKNPEKENQKNTNNYKVRVNQPNIRHKVEYKNVLTPFTQSNTKETKVISKKTEDKGVQFESKMNPGDKESTSNDKLGQLLNQIITIQAQRSNLIDSGTNTDNQAEELNANRLENDMKKTENAIPSTQTCEPTFSSSKQYENAPPLVRSTSDLLNTLQAALSIPPIKRPLISANRAPAQENKQTRTSFKAQVSINQALHLPVRKKCKSKKSKGKTGKGEDNVKPSTYVTFETMPGLDLKITQLVPKSTNPNWNFKCDVFLPSELLFSNQKRLIFKVWRKSTNTNMVPNLQSDLILGFAAIDLTVLLAGFPNIQGWFNITDFSSKCNGQINIHVTPLEDLTIFKTQKDSYVSSVSPSLSNEEQKSATATNKTQEVPMPIENELEEEPDAELLSRALKRKFTELDEITQRLRLRLSHVTNDESDDENDEIADEFEKDINSLSIEDDFDMVNFEDESSNMNIQQSDLLKTCLTLECSAPSSLCGTDSSRSKDLIIPSQEEINKEFEDTEESLTILDKQLLEGKQRIDTLLGKLSLISGDANQFSSRYVSGCSTSNRSDSNVDTEAVLKDLDLHSRPNIHGPDYDTAMFDRIYHVADKRHESSSSSGTSVISMGDFRAAPDGEGTFIEDKNKTKK